MHPWHGKSTTHRGRLAALRRQKTKTHQWQLYCSQSCNKLWARDPLLQHASTGLGAALDVQVPFDGIQSTISLFDAGTWVADDMKKPTWPLFKTTPMCAEMRQGRGGNLEVANARTQMDGLSPGHDVYWNTTKEGLQHLTQATVLHETLHNITGDNDPQLEILVGAPTTGVSDAINHVLEDNGCAGKN